MDIKEISNNLAQIYYKKETIPILNLGFHIKGNLIIEKYGKGVSSLGKGTNRSVKIASADNANEKL